MSAQADLLDAILADPADDGPRLAYADWLEANGHPAAAEFMRLEIERAQLPYVPLTDHSRDLERRAARLFRQHRPGWLGPLHRPTSKLIAYSFSDRGLLHLMVSCTAASFLQKADDLLGGLVLPYALDLQPKRARPLLAELLACPYLTRVTRLRLDGEGLGKEGAKALAGCSGLRHLEHLWIFDDQLGDSGAAALAASPHLGRLGALVIVRDTLTASALVKLLRSRRLRGLQWLWLGSDELKIEGLAPHDTAPGRPRLTTLTLGGKGLDDGTAAWVAGSPGFASLNSLELSGGTIGPAGAAALARSPHLAGLTLLYLNGNPLGDSGARHLAKSKYLTELRDLWLMDCGIGPEGARALLEARHPPHWTYLSDNPLDAATRRLLNREPRRFSV